MLRPDGWVNAIRSSVDGKHIVYPYSQRKYLEEFVAAMNEHSRQEHRVYESLKEK